MNKTGGCISARCPCRTELSWCLIHVCRINCKAEAERHQILKTLLKVLCKGALWWRCPHSSGAGGCPALLCLAPLCLEERRGLCLWAPMRAGSPRSSTGSSWEFGGKQKVDDPLPPRSPAALQRVFSLQAQKCWGNPTSGWSKPDFNKAKPLLVKLGCTLN